MADTKYDKEFRAKFRPMIDRMKKHEANVQAIIDSFLARPERSNAYWKEIERKINAEYVAMGREFAAWAEKNYPQFYDQVTREWMKYSRGLKSITNTPKLSVNELVRTDMAVQTTTTLYQSAIDDFLGALALGKRQVSRLIRATRQTLLAEYQVDKAVADAYSKGNLRIAKTMSKPGSLAAQLVKQLQGGKIVTIIDKNGNPRNYSVSYYSELVARTKWHEAQQLAVKGVAANYGTDLVRVSSHNTTTAICQQYEGKVFSISGQSKDFPFLDMSPPYHPNCLHYIAVTFAETLKATGQYDGYKAFSNNEAATPPGSSSFIPVSERDAA